jgi:hypothetical protein
LKPALFATARILPVDGWMTIIELLLCCATAARAACSADPSIVVASPATFLGATTTAWVWATVVPVAFWISTVTPGAPWPGGAPASRFVVMWFSPASP